MGHTPPSLHVSSLTIIVVTVVVRVYIQVCSEYEVNVMKLILFEMSFELASAWEIVYGCVLGNYLSYVVELYDEFRFL